MNRHLVRKGQGLIPLQPQRNPNVNRGCAIIFGLIFLLSFSIPSVVVIYFAFRGSHTVTSWANYLWLLLPLGVIVAFMGAAWRSLTRRRLGKPTILVTRNPLRVGEPFTVGCDLTVRSGMRLKNLALQLVFREEATYSQGSSSSTARKEWIVATGGVVDRRFERGERFLEQYAWQIPPQGMHSFSSHHNKLVWVIRLRREPQGAPAISDEFPLTVLPERMP